MLLKYTETSNSTKCPSTFYILKKKKLSELETSGSVVMAILIILFAKLSLVPKM